MKIVIDAYGGDNAPYEIVKGAVLSVNGNKDLSIVLVGKQQEVENILKEFKYNADQIEVINASDVISNDESPTTAIRTKKDSSLVVAFDKMKENNYDGLISAGSTGAILTGAILKIGRIKGVSRPAMCPILPTTKGTPVCICDCGANMDCKPVNLCHFAVMASEYLKATMNVENPRVAILNVGAEDHKGNELVKQTFPLLKELPINFIGSVEARDLLSGDYDVVVCDGFAGNVLLKSTEGAVVTVLKMLKKEIKSKFRCKLGALLMKPAFKDLKGKLDYTSYGGSPFIGCKKIVIKAHGTSKAENIRECINQTIKLSKCETNDIIEEKLSKLNIEV